MLYDLYGHRITEIPRREFYDHYRNAMSDVDYRGVIEAIHGELDQAIAQKGEEAVVKSSWIPGRNWLNTPYHPIYLACNQDFDQAKLFFGLLFWDAVMQHAEGWRFYKEDDPFKPTGMTYFRYLQ